MKYLKRILIFLLILAIVLLAVFLTGRYGWKLGGFNTCETAGIEQVNVKEDHVRIRGFYPRFALYGSKYTVLLANRMNEKSDFLCDIAGRCCESGDIIQPNVLIPKPVRNDIVAVCTTGAYNYSMASNYNRIPRPPVVMLSQGKDYIAVKRESFENLTALDV